MSNPAVTHSTLSFSGRKRWQACPASVHFGAGIEDEGSPFAKEGTAAHSVAEFYVRQTFDLPGAQAGESPDIALPEGIDVEAIAWNEELRAAARAYVTFIRTLIPEGVRIGTDCFISLEVKVAAKSIDPRLFGTADLLIWFPAWKHLIVVDYKYGFADVPVRDPGTMALNPQLTAYLIAALDQCTLVAEGATLAVFQPRRVTGSPGQLERLTAADIAAERAALAEDAERVTVTLQRIAECTHEDEFAELCNPGEHCRYCKATKGTCPAMIDGVQTVLDTAAGNVSLLDMPDDDLLALYALRTAIKSFMENVEQKIELMAKSGHPRIVRETRAGRRIWLPDARNALLALGLEELLTPGKVSDADGKVPAEFHEILFTRSRESYSLKVLDAPGESATAKIFEKYSKSGA